MELPEVKQAGFSNLMYDYTSLLEKGRIIIHSPKRGYEAGVQSYSPVLNETYIAGRLWASIQLGLYVPLKKVRVVRTPFTKAFCRCMHLESF